MGELTMSAYNFETATTMGLEAEGVTEAPLLVPGRLLADVAAHLTGTVTLTVEARALIVTAGRRSFRMGLMDAGAYPQVPPAPVTSGRVEAADLQDLLARVAVAATTIPNANPRLDLAHLIAAGGTLTALASDRYRAARTTVAWDGQDFDLQVPAVALAAAVKGMTGPVAIGASASTVAVQARDRTAIVGLAAGEPLPIDRLLAEPHSGGFTVDRAELIEAVSAAKVGIEQNAPVVLAVADGALEISSTSDRSQASDVLDVTGDLEITWLINPAFLADLLAALPGVRVQFMAHTQRPATNSIQLVGVDADDQPDGSCTYLLVPLRK
jgi:DNA polymerase-3 subunit beta